MRRWEVLDKLIKQNGFRSIAELGCKEGKTTEFLLANNPELHIFAVDLFAPQPKQDGIEGGETYEDWNFSEIQAEFNRRTAAFSNRIFLSVGLTSQACNLLNDEKLDLIFIDADHSYNGVATDIQMWLPKVRSGGIVAGHDFNQKWPSVQRAVAENLPIHEIQLEPESVGGWRKP